ncbi:MAG: hypothetical protein H7Y86_06520 [Rhizobacter sp.]|nr:hypothetical protein [Ferruginibacter sp.]
MPANNSGIQSIHPEPGTQFARRSLLLIAGNFIKLAVQLAVIYIYSRNLPVPDYGRYQSVWLYTSVFSVISLFGLPAILLSAAASDIRKWMDANKKLLAGLLALLVLVPFAWILSLNEQFTLQDRLLLCSLILLQNCSIITETLAIKNEKEARVLLVNIIFNAGYLLAHLWVLQQYQFSLTSLLIYLNALLFVKSLLFIAGKNRRRISSEQHVPAILSGRQWLYLGLYDIIAVLFKWIDKWIILVFISLNEFAIYFNGSYEIPLFIMLSGAVGNIIVVELAKLKTINAALAVQLFRRSSIFLSSLILPAFCFLVFFNREFFLFIFSNKYEAAIPVFFASIFIIPVRIINHTAALQVYHKNNIILSGALIDLLLAIIFLAILYPIFGLPGVALAFVLSTYVQAAYYLKQTSSLLKVSVLKLHPFRMMGWICIISLTAMAVCYFVCRNLTDVYSLGAGLLCSAMLAGSFFLFFYKRKFF